MEYFKRNFVGMPVGLFYYLLIFVVSIISIKESDLQDRVDWLDKKFFDF